MVDQTPRYRRVAPYKFEQSVRTEDPVAVFLSDCDDQPDPSEYVTPLRKDGRRFVSARILAGVLATAAAAILFAMFSSDATRDIIVNAKASIAASLPAPYVALQPDPAQLTAHDTQLRNPNDAARLSAPANQTPGVRAVTRSRWRRRVRKSRRPTRVRCRAAAPPPQHRRALQRRLPQRRRPRHQLPLCRRHLSQGP